MKKAYFYSENADQFTFFRVPKILFTDEYINISSDAKLLYGNEVRDYLEEKLEIEILKQSHPYDTQELDEIFEILVNTLCSTKKTIRISGDEKPLEVVKSVFMKLDSSHIEYALECFKKNTTEVRNIRAYMLATLYNASFTMNS